MKRILLLILLATTMLFVVACSSEKDPGMEDIENARSAYSKGFYLEAEKGYERYLQLEPQGEFRKEAWDRLSEISVAIKGDLDRTVVLLEAMYLELGTDPHEAWRIMFQLGDVYAQLGNQAKGIESYEKCLIHAEGNPEQTFKTHIRLAELYRALGNYDLVSVTLENCANSAGTEENKALCLYELAQSYTLIKNWKHSKRALERLLELNEVTEETRVLAVFLLADIYENERDYRKTKELLESIAQTYPNPKVIESRLANLPYVPPVKEEPKPPKQ